MTTPPAPGPIASVTEVAGLRRLTASQYRHTIRDLLGAGLDVPAELDADVSLGGFASVGAAQTPYSSTGVEKLESAAHALARQVVGDANRRGALMPCTPTGPGDAACIRSFVGAFGRRAFRRPLAADEIDSYAAVFTKGATQTGDLNDGLAYTLAAFLQSPSFLYRVERGTPDSGGRRRLRGFELATRLSYFLLDTTPSDALLSSAERGALDSPEGLRAEAEKLLILPAAREALAGFFIELLAVEEAAGLRKDGTLFKAMTPTLGAAMLGETQRFVAEIVLAPEASVLSLLDGQETFVNAELVRLYGLPTPAGTGFTRVRLAAGHPRAGLGVLGQASFLATHAHVDSTSPTRRGVILRRQLLCQTIPEPPPGTDTDLEPVPSGTARTMRERLAEHAKNASCAACHRAIDPMGLALETFDGLGVHRDKENGLLIDTSGEIDGQPFRNPVELAARLRAHDAFTGCLVRQLHRHATGRVETATDDAQLAQLVKALEAGKHRFSALALALITSDAFRDAGNN